MFTGPNLNLQPTCIDSAQYSMLCALQHDQQGGNVPAPLFLRHLRASCLAQHAADAEYQVHWSRHLLACIREITAAQLQIGARAVAYNPHFSFFVSPFSGDRWLGAVTEWPPVTALFTPDSYAPAARRDQWQKIATHQASVWILIQEQPCPSFLDDMDQMRRLGARLCISMSPTSKVVHQTA